MTRLDPQRMTGVTGYPPPAVPCACRHMHATYEVVAAGRRGQCRSGGPDGPCPCTRYQAGGDCGQH